MDLTFPLQFGEQEVTVKTGFDQTNNYRDAQVRSYRFLAEGGPIPTDGLDNRIDYIFEAVSYTHLTLPTTPYV